MFITPLFGGCKYTNKILIINNIAVFQHFNLLITLCHPEWNAAPVILNGMQWSEGSPELTEDGVPSLALRMTGRDSLMASHNGPPA